MRDCLKTGASFVGCRDTEDQGQPIRVCACKSDKCNSSLTLKPLLQTLAIFISIIYLIL